MRMTNEEILQIATEQSAIDLGCGWEDFFSEENKIVLSGPHEKARRYLELPFSLDMVSYGNNIVASCSPAYVETARRYLERFSMAHCFETPNLHVLEAELEKAGQQICFMAEYFLPDVNALRVLECPYDTRILGTEDFAELYIPAWGNALCEQRKHLDVLAVGAYDGNRLVGLAGCSADCDSMWQIGIDVLPDHRRRGVASALTSRLAAEILARGKVPFYCAAWCNLRSVRNALKSGFRPAWVEITAKPREFVEKMNQG